MAGMLQGFRVEGLGFRVWGCSWVGWGSYDLIISCLRNFRHILISERPKSNTPAPKHTDTLNLKPWAESSDT